MKLLITFIIMIMADLKFSTKTTSSNITKENSRSDRRIFIHGCKRLKMLKAASSTSADLTRNMAFMYKKMAKLSF